MNYFDAYKLRMERVDKMLRELSQQLKDNGCKVFAPKHGLIPFIKVFKEGKHIIVGFGEVPYHWYLQICLKPSVELGSGKTTEKVYSEENPFTVNHILDSLQPNPEVKDFTVPNYLQEI